jgi:thioredoxin 1
VWEVSNADGHAGNPRVLEPAPTSGALAGKKRAPRLVERENRRKDTMPTEATEVTFEQEVLSGEGKVIVDFWAEWCGPCHAVAPVLDRIADDHSLRIVKVNIDEEQALALRYGVASIPMMILFENGEPQAAAVGAMPKGALERQLGLTDEE